MYVLPVEAGAGLFGMLLLGSLEPWIYFNGLALVCCCFVRACVLVPLFDDRNLLPLGDRKVEQK